MFKKDISIQKNLPRALKPLAASLCLTLFFGVAPQARAADFIDYFSGCITAMGAGLAGTAYANTQLNPGDKISLEGYGISAGLSCLAGIALVGVVSGQAEFNATWKLKEENKNLTYQLRRMQKERCTLKDACEPGGNAIITDEEPETRKQGDHVFSTYTSKIEPNE